MIKYGLLAVWVALLLASLFSLSSLDIETGSNIITLIVVIICCIGAYKEANNETNKLNA